MKRSGSRERTSFVMVLAILWTLASFSSVGIAADATPIVPETEAPAATSIPDDIDAAAPIGGLTVEFFECGDAVRNGTTDFFFSGEFGAAASTSATHCAPAQFINGAAIQVTLNSDSQAYAELLDSSGMVAFGPEVEEGTYSVAVIAGEEYFGVMTSTIVLEPGLSYALTVVRYVAPDPDLPPILLLSGSIQGSFARCINAERAGTIDVLIRQEEFNLQGAAESSLCTDPDPAPTTLRISGTDVLGFPHSQDQLVVDAFGFLLVPYGTYTITDLGTGAVSAPFNIGGSNGANLDTLVFSYLQPPPTPTPTWTPEPTATNTPEPTATWTPEPTATNTPEPTATWTPEPTATSTTTIVATWTPTDPAEETSPTATSDPGEVDTLPSTGAGSTNSSGLLAAMVVAAFSLLGLAWRARTRS